MVYIVTDDSGYVKIGVATNVTARVKELQCGNPRAIRVIKTIRIYYGDDYRVEHALHKRYENARVVTNGTKSEWFRTDGVAELLNANLEETKFIMWDCGAKGNVTVNNYIGKASTPISALGNYLPCATYHKIIDEGIETIEELKDVVEECKGYIGFGISGIGEQREKQIIRALKAYDEDVGK